jgi:hypothetical protein
MANPRPQRAVIQPEGKTVWTDEFDPAGEYLPESVIQVRRARRAYEQAPVEAPSNLGLDLSTKDAPPLDSQQFKQNDAASLPDQSEMLHHTMLLNLLRGSGVA